LTTEEPNQPQPRCQPPRVLMVESSRAPAASFPEMLQNFQPAAPSPMVGWRAVAVTSLEAQPVPKALLEEFASGPLQGDKAEAEAKAGWAELIYTRLCSGEQKAAALLGRPPGWRWATPDDLWARALDLASLLRPKTRGHLIGFAGEALIDHFLRCMAAHQPIDRRGIETPEWVSLYVPQARADFEVSDGWLEAKSTTTLLEDLKGRPPQLSLAQARDLRDENGWVLRVIDALREQPQLEVWSFPVGEAPTRILLL
jgi:hypothetical protein